MDMQFISLLNRNKINLNKIKGVFRESSINRGNEIIKEYYLINGKKIEVVYLNSDEEVPLYCNKDIKKTFIIAEEVNDKNEKNLLIENAIVLAGKNNSDCKHVVLVNQLYNNEILNLELLIKILENDDEYTKLKVQQQNLKMIIGECKKDKIISDIVMKTLKDINIIQNCTEMNLDIYLNVELDLKDLWNIEDPIKEYINCSKLKIKQSLTFNHEIDSYYCLVIV